MREEGVCVWRRESEALKGRGEKRARRLEGGAIRVRSEERRRACLSECVRACVCMCVCVSAMRGEGVCVWRRECEARKGLFEAIRKRGAERARRVEEMG